MRAPLCSRRCRPRPGRSGRPTWSSSAERTWRLASNPWAAPRLAAQTHRQGWAIWAALTGTELPPSPEQPFAHLHFAIDAAIAGLGVAVMPWPLVADYVRSGRLVAPFGFRKAESAFALLAASASADPVGSQLAGGGGAKAPIPVSALEPVATR